MAAPSVGRRPAHHGRPFYALLATLVGLVIFVGSVAFALCGLAIDTLGEQARNGLRIALSTSMAYLGELRDTIDLEAVAAELDEDGLVSDLAQEDQVSPSDAEALAARVAKVEERNGWDSQNKLLVYLRKSDLTIGALGETSGSAGGLQAAIGETLRRSSETDTRFVFDDAGTPSSVRTASLGEGALVAFVTVGQPEFQGGLDHVLGEYGYQLCYYDSHGAAVAVEGSDDSLIGLFDYASLGDEDAGTLSFVSDGVPYTCCFEKVSDSDTKFALFAVDTAAQVKASVLKTLAIASVAAAVLALLLAWLLATKLYAPVQSIVESLPPSDGGMCAPTPTEGIRDDYRIIGNALAAQSEALAAQHDLLRRAALLRRLHGSDGDMHETYDCSDERFFFDEHERPFAVAVMRVDATTEDAEREPADTSVDSEHIAGEVQPLLSSLGYRCEAVWDTGMLVLVFDMRGCNSFGLGAALENARSELERRDGLLPSFFVGSVHHAPDELSVAYDEAIEAARYCTLLERYNTVQGYDGICPQVQPQIQGGLPDRALLRKTVDAVECLDSPGALEGLDTLLSRLSADGTAGLVEAKTTMGLLCSSLADAVLRIDDGAVTDRCVLLARADEILKSENPADLRRSVAATLEEVGEQNARQRTDCGRFEQIKAFVDEHYANPNLSAGAVAERFGTCQSNVTRLFKKYNGTGFLEYLHTVRVGRAKELLRTTALPVAEVAALVGYTNPLTLTRAFRRCTGVTPGAYKRGDA